MGHREHRHEAPRRIRCAVVTVSDSRTPETDESGRLVRELLEAAGHQVAAYDLVPDDEGGIRETVAGLAGRPEVDAILISGGTGIARRDRSFEAVSSLLTTRIDGFGEIFRSLSYQEIGAAAILSRAVAGLIDSTALFSMPGSPRAVRLAMEALVLPELGHVVGEARK